MKSNTRLQKASQFLRPSVLLFLFLQPKGCEALSNGTVSVISKVSSANETNTKHLFPVVIGAPENLAHQQVDHGAEN